MAQEDNLDGFFENGDIMEFVAETVYTYFLCGVCGSEDVKKELDKRSNVFDHLPPGPMAFACVTLLNN